MAVFSRHGGAPIHDQPIFAVWLGAIRAKIVGRANEALISHNVPNDWQQIRARLVQVFGERRDISTLCQGISNLRQEKKSLDDFYNEVTSLNTDISQKVQQDQNYQGHHVAVMHFVEMLTRNAFIDGLNEPYSLYTRNYRPQSLEEAYRAAQEQMLAVSRKKERFPSNISRENSQKPRGNQNFSRGNQAQASQSFPRNSGRNPENASRNFNRNSQLPENASRNFNANFQPSSSRALQNSTPMEVDTSVRSRQSFSQPMSVSQRTRNNQIASAEQEDFVDEDETSNENVANSDEECDDSNFHLAGQPEAIG